MTVLAHKFRNAKVVQLDEDHLFGVVELADEIDGVGFAAFRKGAGNLVRISRKLELGATLSGTVLINGSNMGTVEEFSLED